LQEMEQAMEQEMGTHVLAPRGRSACEAVGPSRGPSERLP